MKGFNPRQRSEGYYVTGTAADALQWIRDSSLEEKDKEALSRFVNRFPALTFYRETEAFYEAYQKERNILLPAWLRKLRSVLAFVQEKSVEFRLSDHHDAWQPPAQYQDNYWYRPIMYYENEQEPDMLSPYHPLAHHEPRYFSSLAFKLDEHDQSVYGFSLESVQEAIDDGETVEDVVYSVFDTYTMLLDLIVELRFSNGTTIKAL